MLNKKPKLVLARLTPSMPQDEKARNLIVALKKSGITVKSSGERRGESSDPKTR